MFGLDVLCPGPHYGEGNGMGLTSWFLHSSADMRTAERGNTLTQSLHNIFIINIHLRDPERMNYIHRLLAK